MKNLLNILIIDDDRVSQIYLSELIDIVIGKAKVVRADCGEQALELLKKQSFHFIFSDILMPGLSEEKLFSELKEAIRFSSSTKIVAVSGIDDINEIKKMAPGASMIMKKPLDRNALKDILSGAGVEIKEENITASDEIVIDLNLIVKLYQNKPEKLLNLLNLYRKSLPQQYSNLRNAFEQKNTQLLKSNAHSLKNSFSYLGASELKKKSSYVEENAMSSSNLEKLNSYISVVLSSEPQVLNKIDELIRSYE
jgi:YesN/AraC family two-component response regulator